MKTAKTTNDKPHVENTENDSTYRLKVIVPATTTDEYIQTIRRISGYRNECQVKCIEGVKENPLLTFDIMILDDFKRIIHEHILGGY